MEYLLEDARGVVIEPEPRGWSDIVEMARERKARGEKVYIVEVVDIDEEEWSED